MKTFMFPGQGAQSKGMGGTLFDEFPDLTDKANNILGYSIKELCLENPRKELNDTQFTQPALFVVNALSYYKKVESNGEPDFLIGHSLGEFNALHASGCFDFETGIKLVKKRGELMANAPSGSMAAILNSSKQEITRILKENELHRVDLANYNTRSQIVISGPSEEIAKAQDYFKFGNVLYYPLNTSGAFHSHLMKPSGELFENYLKQFNFDNLTIPVISNVNAIEYQDEDAIDCLARQISSTVKWTESIEYLMAQGNGTAMEFEEIGNGDVLTKILATIQSELLTDTASQSVKNDVETGIKDEKLTIGSTDIGKSDQDKNAKVVVHDFNRIAEEKVRNWNETHPIGGIFKSNIAEYSELVTRTEATVLFKHRAAVYMEGFKGYFDIDELSPV